MKIYYSGYDNRFVEIGKKYGPVDFAIMECGQYNETWQYVHNLPEEVRKSTLEIGAKRMMAVHHSKFKLANHSWDEPLIRMTELAQNQPYLLATPMIGEIVNLADTAQSFSQWWKKVR